MDEKDTQVRMLRGAEARLCSIVAAQAAVLRQVLVELKDFEHHHKAHGWPEHTFPEFEKWTAVKLAKGLQFPTTKLSHMPILVVEKIVHEATELPDKMPDPVFEKLSKMDMETLLRNNSLLFKERILKSLKDHTVTVTPWAGQPGMFCRPLKANVPEAPRGAVLTPCPVCDKDCWRMSTEPLPLPSGMKAGCTECALKQGISKKKETGP